jgi:nicotinamidase-related amidase
MATSLSAAIRSALDLCSRQTLIFRTAPLRELWPQPETRKRHVADVYRTKEDKHYLRVDFDVHRHAGRPSAMHGFFCPLKVFFVSFPLAAARETMPCTSSELTMWTPAAALLVIDVQESFRHRPYWCDCDVPSFIERLQALIDGAKARQIPVLQIFHVEDSGPFSVQSRYVVPLRGVSIEPDARFYKRSHSALVGSGLDVWLTQHGIGRVITSGIRTEQCCETTTRHASDLGYRVDYVTEATLTFPMTDRHGRKWSPEEIKARTEVVLDGRFARILTVEQVLAGSMQQLVR